jgi:hypothetical protein
MELVAINGNNGTLLRSCKTKENAGKPSLVPLYEKSYFSVPKSSASASSATLATNSFYRNYSGLVYRRIPTQIINAKGFDVSSSDLKLQFHVRFFFFTNYSFLSILSSHFCEILIYMGRYLNE